MQRYNDFTIELKLSTFDLNKLVYTLELLTQLPAVFLHDACILQKKLLGYLCYFQMKHGQKPCGSQQKQQSAVLINNIIGVSS